MQMSRTLTMLDIQDKMYTVITLTNKSVKDTHNIPRACVVAQGTLVIFSLVRNALISNIVFVLL